MSSNSIEIEIKSTDKLKKKKELGCGKGYKYTNMDKCVESLEIQVS